MTSGGGHGPAWPELELVAPSLVGKFGMGGAGLGAGRDGLGELDTTIASAGGVTSFEGLTWGSGGGAGTFGRSSWSLDAGGIEDGGGASSCISTSVGPSGTLEGDLVWRARRAGD